MTLPIPLTVRLSTAKGDRHVTTEARDLSIRWTDPGGYASCRISLDRPLILQPDEIAYYGIVTVYDGRTGLVVWEGRLEDPGRSAGGDGQVWDLVAVGGQAHTRDRTLPLIYVDTTISDTYQVEKVKPGFEAGLGADPGSTTTDRQAMVFRLPEGITVTLGDLAAMRYARVWEAGMKLARISYSWDAGGTNLSWVIQSIARTDGSFASGDTAASVTMNSAGGTSAAVVVTNFTNGRNTVDFRFHQTAGGAVKTTNDSHWASVFNLIVRTMLYDKTGAEITTGYTGNTVLASEIVADLLGRVLTAYDGAGATVETTTHTIDQLAYADGVDAARVLEDMLAVEAGFTWRVWERSPTTGKYRFEWVAGPSTVRYEADVLDDYDAPGSADGLFNRVMVRYVDSRGRRRSTIRTTTVTALDDAGLIRQGYLDLGDEAGTLTNAQRAGDQWLADRRYPPNGGRLRIARPILDLQAGRLVQPWEIRPGLIRVRGVLPRPDALNATARDGVTVMRIVAAEYRASDAAAVLELDSYAPSTARALANLKRRPYSPRRR